EEQAVAARAPGDDVRLADDPGGSHAERLEDALVEELAVVLAGDLRDDHAEDDVAGVAVAVARAGGGGERGAREDAQQVLVGVVLAAVNLLAAVLLEAGSVVEQVADGDVLPAGRGAVQVLADGRVETELAGLRQQQDGGGGELLADRTGLVDRLGPG